MKLSGLYVEKKSFVHDIDSITKIFYIIFAICLPIVLPSLKVAFICVATSIILLAMAGVLKNAIPMFLFISFILFTIVIVQGLFGIDNETVAFSVFGITFYKEGLMESLKIILRVINIVSSFLILALTTKPSDLVEDLVNAGLSPKIGYVIGSVFQILPQMMSTVDTISDAQRSRGMETEGKLIVRIKAFIPLLGPVVLNSFINTKERAMALEVRAFGASNKKVFLNETKKYKNRYIIRVTLVIVMIVALVWRVIF